MSMKKTLAKRVALHAANLMHCHVWTAPCWQGVVERWMRFIAQGAVMSPAFVAAGLWLLALMGFAATSPNHRNALLLRLTVQRVFRLWRNLRLRLTSSRASPRQFLDILFAAQALVAR